MTYRDPGYVADLRRSLAVGLSPVQVADDLGVRTISVARRLYRYGDHELARVFERANYEDSKHSTPVGK